LADPALRVVSGTLLFPRGGSAFVTRALARGLGERGARLTLIAGSRHDLGPQGDARCFYAGIDLHEVDFTPALAAPDPMTFAGPPGTAPLQPSFEDRPGAPDRVFASLGDDAYELHARAWARELRAAGAAGAGVLHLHHLTPLNAAAALTAPRVPVVGQLHGTELLMLQAIAAGSGWAHGAAWARRLRRWAADCAEIVVAPGNRERAVSLLDVPHERVTPLPNGFDPDVFRPLEVDRQAVWRRVLVDEPRGWAPGREPGSIRYPAEAVAALARGPVIVYVGRFTEVKRLPLLLEAFAQARDAFGFPASLILVGGHPGEWEGEHPAEAIERLGLARVMLAGWYEQTELPELLAASDLLVLPSSQEAFGQVLVEAMACGVPAVAAAALGPAHILEDGELGWLFAPDDRSSLAAALVEAVNGPDERARRARRAREEAPRRFCWPSIAERLEGILRRARGPIPPARRPAPS
jgi:glycosyltransferase involved in cell wall biosynthesis